MVSEPNFDMRSSCFFLFQVHVLFLSNRPCTNPPRHHPRTLESKKQRSEAPPINNRALHYKTQRQSALEQQTHAMNHKMDLLLKYFGKHEIGEYVDETFRKHIRSQHTGSSHQSNEFTNLLHDNLGKLNLGSNRIA